MASSATQRRDAFKHLIEISRSDQAENKLRLTRSVGQYFGDFADLQDDAINAVYDLCEDQDPKIRIAGYNAITAISRADNAWLGRNADVLVQLLQNDDQTEVNVVKSALIQHIDMDPRKTVKVLCDQCVVQEEGSDPEELSMRTKFRSLVLRFLSEDAKGKMIEVLKASQSRDGIEDGLFEGLSNSLRTCTAQEAIIIVERILIPALLFSQNLSSRTSELIESLSSVAVSSLKRELLASAATTPPQPNTLSLTLTFLRLGQHICSTQNGNPFILLGSYLNSNLITKSVFSQITESAKMEIFRLFMLAWSAFSRAAKTSSNIFNRIQVTTARDRVVQLTPILLEVITSHSDRNAAEISRLLPLLAACQSRITDSNPPWKLPPNLIALIREVYYLAQREAPTESNGTRRTTAQAAPLQAIQTICRSLLEPARAAPASSSQSVPPVPLIRRSSNVGLPQKPPWINPGQEISQGTVTIGNVARNASFTASVNQGQETSARKRKFGEKQTQQENESTARPSEPGGLSIFNAATRGRMTDKEDPRASTLSELPSAVVKRARREGGNSVVIRPDGPKAVSSGSDLNPPSLLSRLKGAEANRASADADTSDGIRGGVRVRQPIAGQNTTLANRIAGSSSSWDSSYDSNTIDQGCTHTSSSHAFVNDSPNGIPSSVRRDRPKPAGRGQDIPAPSAQRLRGTIDAPLRVKGQASSMGDNDAKPVAWGGIKIKGAASHSEVEVAEATSLLERMTSDDTPSTGGRGNSRARKRRMGKLQVS